MTNKLLIQKIFLCLSDVLALALAFISAIILTRVISIHAATYHYSSIKTFGIAKSLGLLLLVIFWYQEQYMKRRPVWEEIKLLYQTILVFAVIHLGGSYLLSHHVIKILNVVFWLLVLLYIPILRLITKKLLMRCHLWQRKIFIVGDGEDASTVFQLLNHSEVLGYQVMGFVELDQAKYQAMVEKMIEVGAIDAKIRAKVYSYEELLQRVSSDTEEVVFALNASQLAQFSSVISVLQSKFLFVSIFPDIKELPLYGVTMEHFFGSDQVFLRLQNNLARRANRLIKRSFDVITAALALIVLSPLLLVIAAIVKLTSPGGVIYAHSRIGCDGATFACLKFRTMYSDSKDKLDALLKSDPLLRDEWQKSQKLKNDPRITQVGKFLRKLSLDELPQLLNVLIGNMSIVGPRPIVNEEVLRYGDYFYYYKLVKPGITGLWQISGRNDIEYASRVRLDVWYVKNWSLWCDLVICFQTISVVLSRSGAY